MGDQRQVNGGNGPSFWGMESFSLAEIKTSHRPHRKKVWWGQLRIRKKSQAARKLKRSQRKEEYTTGTLRNRNHKREVRQRKFELPSRWIIHHHEWQPQETQCWISKAHNVKYIITVQIVKAELQNYERRKMALFEISKGVNITRSGIHRARLILQR